MEFLAGKMLGYILILTRISAFFTASPLFSWEAIPVRSKITIALLTSAFFAMLTPCQFTTENLQFIQIVLLASNEFFYGLTIGMVAYSLFSVVRVAGRIVENQMGLNMANILDPFSNEQGQPVGLLLEIIFVFLLFSTDSHHLLVQILGRSFQSFAPGYCPEIGMLVKSVLTAGSMLFVLALQMAAPMLAAFLLLMVVLAFMARVSPESNILFLSLPLRVGMGLILVAVFIPFLTNFITTFTTWLKHLIPL